LRYGFKASAERIAKEIRAKLQLAPEDILCPWELAQHLGIIVFDIAELPVPANDLRQLTHVDSDSWSALTIKAHGFSAVILNPTHGKARQRNDLMHEVAHVHLGHVPHRVDTTSDGLLLVSDFSKDHEEEADWLAAALLLPREALLWCRKAGHSVGQICQKYGISRPLCEWRLRMTGVDRQMANSKAKRS
jgi:Zn-dependent peptidase ImmA (M78 family)